MYLLTRSTLPYMYFYRLIFGSRGPFDVITRNDLPLNLNLTWSQPFVKTIENKIDSNNIVSFPSLYTEACSFITYMCVLCKYSHLLTHSKIYGFQNYIPVQKLVGRVISASSLSSTRTMLSSKYDSRWFLVFLYTKSYEKAIYMYH